jgi:hypothetical protein
MRPTLWRLGGEIETGKLGIYREINTEKDAA